MKFVSTAKGLFFALVLSTSLFANATQWEVDGSHSTVGFKIRHLVVANVDGRFTDFSGVATIDDKDFSKTKLEGTVKTASINTDNAKRDEHLRSPDFFDTAKFPTLTFKTTKAEKKSGKMTLVGELTMKGVTKPVTLEVTELTAPVKGMQGGLLRGFSATTKLNRKDFGLTWNKALEAGGVAVGEEVNVRLEFELHQVEAPATDKKKQS
jgi:polyisoprenoid-binding protein YceI